MVAMTSGSRARAARRLRKAVDQRRELSEYARAAAHELHDSGDLEAAKYWREMADQLYRESVPAAANTLPRLERLVAAFRLFEDARDQGVRQCRLEGASWAQIGAAVGMTREGARKRWGGSVDDT